MGRQRPAGDASRHRGLSTATECVGPHRLAGGDRRDAQGSHDDEPSDQGYTHGFSADWCLRTRRVRMSEEMRDAIEESI